MKKYFLDTSIIIAYLRNRKKIVNLLQNIQAELTSSHICLAELYEGVARAKNFQKAEEGVLQFFSGLDHLYHVNKNIAKKFGKIRAGLKKEGQIIEDLDILLSATCLEYNLEMITLNKKHFQRVPNLKIFPEV